MVDPKPRSSAGSASLAPEAAESGMDPRQQSLLPHHPQEQRSQLIALHFAERGEQRVLMLARDVPDLIEHLPPLSGQVQSVRASVSRMVAPLDQAPVLELIEELDELARDDGESARERLLALSFGSRDRPQNAGMRRRQADWLQSFGKRRRGVAPDLR